jgi:hypothetical protein
MPQKPAGQDKVQKATQAQPMSGIRPEEIGYIAKAEQVTESAVKATIQAVGHDRTKVVAAIRATKPFATH